MFLLNAKIQVANATKDPNHWMDCDFFEQEIVDIGTAMNKLYKHWKMKIPDYKYRLVYIVFETGEEKITAIE